MLVKGLLSASPNYDRATSPEIVSTSSCYSDHRNKHLLPPHVLTAQSAYYDT
jgi:hypothetical protein